METIKLIEGKFCAHESKEILLDLINKKINFHNLKNLSSLVRYNTPDAASEARLQELREAKEQILAIIQDANLENNALYIEANIKVWVETKEQPVERCLEIEIY